MDGRIKYTTYLAGGIEHTDEHGMKTWREQVKEKLASKDLLVYDPITQEASKVGLPPGEHIRQIAGWKRAGLYEKFYEAMWKIWFGVIQQDTDIPTTMNYLRSRKFIDGNRERDMSFWGDTEAVVRSDFIIVYLPKDMKTVGTYYEVWIAATYKIPVYLIIPDTNKTETNSSLLLGVMMSKGEVFYNMNDCVSFIKERYKL
jgi:hypothetical protein